MIASCAAEHSVLPTIDHILSRYQAGLHKEGAHFRENKKVEVEEEKNLLERKNYSHFTLVDSIEKCLQFAIIT